MMELVDVVYEVHIQQETVEEAHAKIQFYKKEIQRLSLIVLEDNITRRKPGNNSNNIN
jgi:hypothetical protein